MAVILPFEENFYREAGVDVTFVGHPLLDEVKTKYPRPEALKRFGLKDEAITVAILPGSRQSEVARLLPEMLGACRILTDKLSPLQFVLPLAGTLDPHFVRDILRQFPVKVNVDPGRDLRRHRRLRRGDRRLGNGHTGNGASGDPDGRRLQGFRSLLCRRPQVHQGGPHQSGEYHRRRTVVPELIQDEANPERIAAEVRELIVQQGKAREMKAAGEIRGNWDPGASQRTARIACDMLAG